jgi:site-specific recombinase XerD
LSQSTERLYKLLFRQLIIFTSKHGLRFIDEVDLAKLTDFRTEWGVELLTALKTLERLRSEFKFALQIKIFDENYAASLIAPKIKQKATLPFTKEEITKILKACDSSEADQRAKAFILTSRYAGMRISDVSVLAVDALRHNRLKLYQAKTGQPVSILLPQDVVNELLAVKRSNQKYFFWTGQSKLTSVTGFWRARGAEVFNLAGVEGHPHRFRDTFAVAPLNGGASIETVSVLLGHTSIRATEKHHNP